MTLKTKVVGFLQYAQGDDVQTYLQRWLAQSLHTTDTLFDPVSGHNHNGSGTNGPTVAGGGGVTMQWRGTWSAATAYSKNDGVAYQGSSYIALNPVTSSTPPPSDPTNWGVLAQGGATGPTGPQGSPGAPGSPGMVWRGAWQTAPTTYATNDVVSYQGSSYIATTGNTATPPPSSSWALVAQGGTTTWGSP